MSEAFDTQALSPSQVTQEILRHWRRAGTTRAACVWGSPGIGKSDIARLAAQSIGYKLIDVRGSLLDPVDLRGLPYLANGISRWAPPIFLPRPEDGPTVLFLDEINRAVPTVQNALLQLVLDRRIGEYELPADCLILSACNDADTGVQKMSDALYSRFTHYSMIADLDDWRSWALETDSDHLSMIVGFLSYRPALLNAYERHARAWPNPRAWVHAGRIVSDPGDAASELAALEGTIGHGAAIELLAFMRVYRSLGSIDAILLDPEHAAVPSAPLDLYAVASAMIHYANAINLDRVIAFLERIAPEYSLFAIKGIVSKDNALAKTDPFIRWVSRHGKDF